jgi:hypothetical protein
MLRIKNTTNISEEYGAAFIRVDQVPLEQWQYFILLLHLIMTDGRCSQCTTNKMFFTIEMEQNP